MPVLDSLKAALADHMKTLISKVSLGSTGGDSSSRDGGIGNSQLSVIPTIQKIDDRTLSITAFFDTQQVTASQIREISIHGANQLDTPAYRGTFLPFNMDENTEVRVDILMEVR